MMIKENLDPPQWAVISRPMITDTVKMHPSSLQLRGKAPLQVASESSQVRVRRLKIELLVAKSLDLIPSMLVLLVVMNMINHQPAFSWMEQSKGNRLPPRSTTMTMNP